MIAHEPLKWYQKSLTFVNLVSYQIRASYEKSHPNNLEVHSELNQTSKMKSFAKMNNGI